MGEPKEPKEKFTKTSVTELVQAALPSFLQRLRTLTIIGAISVPGGVAITAGASHGIGKYVAPYVLLGPQLQKEDISNVDGLRKQLKALQERKKGKGAGQLFGDWTKDFGGDPVGWLARNEPALKARIEAAEKMSGPVFEVYKEYRRITELIIYWASFLAIMYLFTNSGVALVNKILQGRQRRRIDMGMAESINTLGEDLNLTQNELKQLTEELNNAYVKLEEKIVEGQDENSKLIKDLLLFLEKVTRGEKGEGVGSVEDSGKELKSLMERLKDLPKK